METRGPSANHDLLNPPACHCSAPLRDRVIRNLGLFQGASASTLADLGFLLRSRSYRLGQEVNPLTSEAGVFGMVVNGAFKVQRWVGDDRYVIFDLLGPEDFFFYGPAAEGAISSYVYPDLIQSLTTSCVLTMDPRELWPILARDPVLVPRIVSQLNRRLGQMGQRTVSLLSLGAERKLAWLLGFLHGVGAPKPACPGLVPFNLTRRDLASFAGLTLETVSRILSSWERQGWVQSGRGWVELVNPGALEALCRIDEG